MKPETGDIVKITRRGLKVTDVSGDRVWVEDTATGKVRSYYMSEVELEVTKKAPKVPEYWPPQDGDVWRTDAYSTTYHIIGSKAYRNRFGTISPSVDATRLSDYSDLRLVHRNF